MTDQRGICTQRLITRIWQRIRSAVQDEELLIIGPHPENIPAFHRPHDSVRFTEFAADLDSHYRGASLTCCPISGGSGTRIKLIEAAAYGVPAVATPMAAEGLGLLDNTEIFMRSNDEALVAACIQLLLDQVMATAVGNAARARAAALYSRDKIIDKVAALLSSSANDR